MPRTGRACGGLGSVTSATAGRARVVDTGDCGAGTADGAVVSMPNGDRAAPSALVAAVSEPRADERCAGGSAAGELTAAECTAVRARAIVGAVGPTGVVCRTVVVRRADVADVGAAARRAGDVTVVVEAPALDDDATMVEVEPAVAVVPAPAVDGSTRPQTTPAATDPAASDISRRRWAAARPGARSGRRIEVGGASRSPGSGLDELRTADDVGSTGTGTPWGSMQAQTPSQGPVPTASPQPRALPLDVLRVPGPSIARLSDTPSTSRGTPLRRDHCPAAQVTWPSTTARSSRTRR